jgi:hypothetical protein
VSERAIPGNDRDDVLPESLSQVALRWLRHAMVAALGVSIVIHVAGWLVSALIPVLGGGGGAGAPSAGPVEFAVVAEGDLDEAPAGSMELSSPGVPEVSSREPVATDLMDASIEERVGGGSGDLSDLEGTLAGGGDVGTGAGGDGLGGSGGGTGASFFGVEAKGNRFAYIVDVSGSMGVGGKIEALKRALGDSIGGLVENSSFYVVPFSNAADTRPLGGRAEWVEADQAGKRWAVGEITLLRPDGGTEPLEAFRKVFAVKPRPDAVYFMTDGEFDPAVFEELLLLNGKSKVPIHTICFATRDSEELMRKIAKQFRGTYKFVAGPE